MSHPGEKHEVELEQSRRLLLRDEHDPTKRLTELINELAAAEGHADEAPRAPRHGEIF